MLVKKENATYPEILMKFILFVKFLGNNDSQYWNTQHFL